MSTLREDRSSLSAVLSRAGIEASPYAEGSVFLSVVVRTQGRRPLLLAEALASLGAQTDSDFEVIVVRHRAEPAAAAAVDEVVAAAPAGLSITILDLDTGARGAPLNLGFEQARGTHLVGLDDDDLVLPHWVATFRDLSEQQPGRSLRAAALIQRVEPATDADGHVRAVALEEPHRNWPARFELLEHLLVNSTPIMAIAFPRSVFHDLGERYDDELATTEDWDFLVRAVSWTGVVDSDEATSIYRWWEEGESSRHLHDDEAWSDNHRAVQDRLDQQVLLLPPGSVSTLRTMIESRDRRLEEVSAERDREAANAQQLLGEAQAYLAQLDEAQQELGKRRRQVRKLRERLAEQLDSPEPAEQADSPPLTKRWGRTRD